MSPRPDADSLFLSVPPKKKIENVFDHGTSHLQCSCNVPQFSDPGSPTVLPSLNRPSHRLSKSSHHKQCFANHNRSFGFEPAPDSDPHHRAIHSIVPLEWATTGCHACHLSGRTELSCGPISNSVHSNHETVQSTVAPDAQSTSHCFLSGRCSCLCLLTTFLISFLSFAFAFSFHDPFQPNTNTVASESPTVVLTAAIPLAASEVAVATSAGQALASQGTCLQIR